MAENLTEEELLEYKEAFEKYEKGSENGKVDALDLGRLLKSLGEPKNEILELELAFTRSGMNPTDKELNDIITDLKADDNGTLEFPEFLGLMSKKMKNKDSEHELREAFQMLDEQGRGVVKSSEIKYLLVNIMGESEDDVKGMLKEVDPKKTGDINIEDFIKRVLK